MQAQDTSPIPGTILKAIDSRDGRHLRDATEEEAAMYLSQETRYGDAIFRRPVRIGDVLIDVHVPVSEGNPSFGAWLS
jgi:hypothetical protein